MAKNNHGTYRIVVTAYEGVSLLDLSGPLEAFRVASSFGVKKGNRITYECKVVSAKGGRVRTADGIDIVTEPAAKIARKPIDTLIVPGAFDVEAVTKDRALVQWVRRMSPRCKRICSVCIGSFMLADAGILEGKRAATHWMHTARLASKHPKVKVEPDAIFVHDGRVWTSAGVTSGIDLALALIEQDAGRDVAIHVARILVVYLKRAGGQSQYSALLAAQADDSDKFAELEKWIAENLTVDLRVETLAERAFMSPRNFARLYAEHRGRTPAKAVEAIRLDTARRRLEETKERIEKIAAECGFSGEEQMRAAFVRNLNISPRDYRKRFTSSKE